MFKAFAQPVTPKGTKISQKIKGNSSKLTEKNKSVVKIELSTNYFSTNKCTFVPHKTSFVEIYRYKKYFKTMAYPRPLRLIKENVYGICYEGKIYPIKKK